MKSIIIEAALDKVHVRIFTMGGNGIGESFLILFQQDESVLYSILIDSFSTIVKGKDTILPQRFIEHYGIGKLDCIIWSHPHDDHSYGLDTIIEKYHGKKTIGFIPQYVYGNNRDLIPISPTCVKVRKTFKSKFRKNSLIAIDCAAGESRLLIKGEIKDVSREESKNFTLHFLTPIGSPLNQRMAENIPYSQSQLNLLSISMILTVDGYRFYFGGDTPGSIIKQSDTQMINSSRWTTIPHHGSNTSKELRMILKRNIDCASCTTYLSQPLPRTEVLDLYKTPEECRVHVTQKDKQSIFSYGVIEYDYMFSAVPNAKLTIRRYGNAYEYIGSNQHL